MTMPGIHKRQMKMLFKFLMVLCPVLALITIGTEVHSVCLEAADSSVPNHRVTDSLRLEGTSAGHLVQPPA